MCVSILILFIHPNIKINMQVKRFQQQHSGIEKDTRGVRNILRSKHLISRFRLHIAAAEPTLGMGWSHTKIEVRVK